MAAHRRRNQVQAVSNDNHDNADDDFEFSKGVDASNQVNDDLELPWTDFIHTRLYPAVTASRVAERMRIWHHARDRIKNHQEPEGALLPSLLEAVFATIPRYVDKPSRNAVWQVILALKASTRFSKTNDAGDALLVTGITRMLDRELEAASSSCAASILCSYSRFVTNLLELTPASLTNATKILLRQQVYLWQRLTLAESKPRYRAIAVKACRNILRRSGADRVNIVLDWVVATLDADSWKCVLLVHPCIDAISSLEPSMINELMKVFAKAVNSTKGPIPDAYLESFAPFLTKFATPELIESELMASADKLLLRLPEVVLKVYIYVFRYSRVNPSGWFVKLAEALTKHLLSTNEIVQKNAADLVALLSGRSTESILDVANVMIKVLNGKVASPGQRQSMASALGGLPPSFDASVKIVQALTMSATKETNDTVIHIMLTARIPHISYLLEHNQVSKDVQTSIMFGMISERAVYRQGYLTCMESVITSNLGGILDKVTDHALTTLEKVSAAGMGVLEPSRKEAVTLVEGYLALSCLLQSQPSNLEIESLMSKARFALDSKLYSKLETRIPFVNCVLQLVANDITYIKSNTKISSSMADALVFCMASVTQPKIRSIALQRMTRLCQSNHQLIPEFLSLLRVGFSNLVSTHSKSAEPSAWNDKRQACGNELGSLMFKALSSCVRLANRKRYVHQIDDDSRDNKVVAVLKEVTRELVALISIACHPVISDVNGSDAWVRLVVMAGLDPKKILENHGAQLVNSWLDAATLLPFIPALVLCMEIAPATIFPIVISYIVKNLRNSITQYEYEVWQTPPDQLRSEFVYGGPIILMANKAKDWEGQLMEAKGKKPPPKNKAADAKKHSERAQQLAREAEIRQRVQASITQIQSSIALLNAVVASIMGPLGADASEQFETHLTAIIKTTISYATDTQHAAVCKQEVAEVYIHLATTLDLTPMQTSSVAAIILRTLNVEDLPAKWRQNDYEDSMTHLTSSLKKVDHLPTLEFIFIFTLLEAVILREGRITTLREKQVTDMVMTCADILLAHVGLATLSYLPRGNMVRCIIYLLANYPRLHKRGHEGLLTMYAAVGESMAAFEVKNDGENCVAKHSASNIHAENTEVVKELLDGLVSEEPAVREACLSALTYVEVPADLEGDFDARVWTLKHDMSTEQVVQEAAFLWEQWNGEKLVNAAAIAFILPLIVHKTAAVRVAAGLALKSALEVHVDQRSTALEALYKTYGDKKIIPPPEYDDYGMVITHTLNQPDQCHARLGVALALQALAPILVDNDLLIQFFDFLIQSNALGDRSDNVRKTMLQAGVQAVKGPGKSCIKPLLTMFDEFLSRPPGQSEEHDRMREAVVILLGTLSQHLDASDPSIPTVVSKLIETLKTPSEIVQSAVAECLPALVKAIPDMTQDLLGSLLKQMFDSRKYAERRGAAYGLAGIVKGRGISALKDYAIMQALKDAVEDKKHMERREGALFAIETLSLTLGRLFEPFIVQILPLLLVCFGDASKDVRVATEDAARTIMSKLSAHAVKLVLPSLLNGLDDKQWRAKCGSIELLGSMAFLAPKQLSVSLPTIIPRLVEVLSDTHSKVQETAKTALTHFGSIIKNPEIQACVPIILQGMVDPNNKTLPALTALLETTFIHYIDAPSLALVIPILRRGLKERSTDVRKRAAEIMGNIASLTEQKDLIPYLSVLMPGLKEVLVDPVPEARAIAAHALGSMVEKLGEDNFPGLVSELLQTLKSDTSAVDRSGAAQGLSEVLAGIGIDRMEGMLPEVQVNISSRRPYVREGFMLLYIYLPATFGEKFRPYLGSMIHSLLKGLADDAEPVRDAALRAGQMVVRGYANSAIDLLLPELERGLFDNNWRIRQSSIQLMGDLLYRIGGSRKVADGVDKLEEADDDIDGTDTDADDELEEEDTGGITKGALIEALGLERYNKVLAALYIVRSDTISIVRQSSLQVWKAIVVNTPRTLKEIFPIMMSLLISCFSSPSAERRGVAARTLGDLVRKMGEQIMEQIIPILENGIIDGNPATRQGLCIGMTEILAAAGKQQGGEFAMHFIGPIRKALVDGAPEVREAAAQAFDSLHQSLGTKAIDEVLPSLLSDLKSGGGNTVALEALKEIMAVRSSVVFPVLAPTLMARPITSFNARALGTLITVAGSAISRRSGSIVSVLLDALEDHDEGALEASNTINAILLNATADELPSLMMILNEGLREGSIVRRQEACKALAVFFAEAEADINDDINDWMNHLIELMNDEDMMEPATAAVDALIKRIKKEDLDRYVAPVRSAISMATCDLTADECIKGFSNAKGISGVVSIFLQGLSYGSPDIREQAALGLGDIVTRSSSDALKPFVTQMTGPLIRVVGDRFAAGVKSAILYTLGLLLTKVPQLLKPFLPQLQRTFIKALSEQTSNIARERAAHALSLLIPLQPRLDPLVVEVAQGIRTAGDTNVKEAMWQAMHGIIKNLGSGRDINDTSTSTIQTLLLEVVSVPITDTDSDNVKMKAARCIGGFCQYLGGSRAKQLADAINSPTADLYGKVLAYASLLTEAPALIEELAVGDRCQQVLVDGLTSDKLPITEAAVKATLRFLTRSQTSGTDQLVPLLAKLLPVGQNVNIGSSSSISESKSPTY
ncbi:hypothetical protein SeLEV6574_g05373 [Synchytrium endobioticum]|uniref:TOG domain-containing protein n=1 Tax=Synchytrium endobioticum TaxID=286115 RepID=A0A507CUJ5_9FUNG|nr:hypothetical protein SeLEV6574_g05373 [Synchytrium endobioticum]